MRDSVFDDHDYGEENKDRNDFLEVVYEVKYKRANSIHTVRVTDSADILVALQSFQNEFDWDYDELISFRAIEIL